MKKREPMFVSPHGVNVFCEVGDNGIHFAVPSPPTDDVAEDMAIIRDKLMEVFPDDVALGAQLDQILADIRENHQ